jgi:hypothetical protein
VPDSVASAIVVGLAVGIAFVVLFSAFAAPAFQQPQARAAAGTTYSLTMEEKRMLQQDLQSMLMSAHTHTHTHTHLKQLKNEKRRLQTIGDIEDTGDVEKKVRLITQLIKMLRKTIGSLQGDTAVNLEEIANLTQMFVEDTVEGLRSVSDDLSI